MEVAEVPRITVGKTDQLEALSNRDLQRLLGDATAESLRRKSKQRYNNGKPRSALQPQQPVTMNEISWSQAYDVLLKFYDRDSLAKYHTSRVWGLLERLVEESKWQGIGRCTICGFAPRVLQIGNTRPRHEVGCPSRPDHSTVTIAYTRQSLALGLHQVRTIVSDPEWMTSFGYKYPRWVAQDLGRIIAANPAH
jgi:hypothetical protein